MQSHLRPVSRILATALTFGALAVPSALSQGEEGIRGITLQAAPNAVAVRWEAPAGAVIDHYNVYYSRASLLAGNGRFDGKEATIGDETTLVLLDLTNRGFQNGDTIFVTVTAVDGSGKENSAFAEEQRSIVQAPGATALAQAPATGTVPLALENAVSDGPTTVRLSFSNIPRLPADSPALHFSVKDEGTGAPLGVTSVTAEGNDIVLTTFGMTPRSRYAVSVSGGITGADGAPLDPAKAQATFVARGAEEVAAPPQGGPELLPIPGMDRTPPEPPRNLILRRVLQENGLYTVHASWEESLNTAADLAAYHLYESEDFGMTFASPAALRATVASATLTDIPPGSLTVKLTAVDAAKNESDGPEETIILPETGPALALALSFAGATVWSVARRRKKAESD